VQRLVPNRNALHASAGSAIADAGIPALNSARALPCSIRTT